MRRSDLDDHADVLSLADLRVLAERRSGPCVSITLPTHPVGRETHQDPMLLRKLVESAQHQLIELDIGRRRAGEILEPVRALLDDGAFWRHQGDGLALYAAPGFHRRFRVGRRLVEGVTVGDRFVIRPVLAALDFDGHFFVLALAQNHVRLHRATRFAIEEVVDAPIPASMAEALAHEDPERQLQYRSGGDPGAQFHGHGVGDEIDKQVLERFIRAVDRGVLETVGDDSSPLVLATVAYYAPIYRSVTHHPCVLDRIVEGNPERRSAGDLHAAAWSIVEQIVAGERAAAIDAAQQAPTARLAADLAEIVRAARDGAVATLFVASDEPAWGRVDAETGEVRVEEDAPTAGAEDLLEHAVADTVLGGGTVFVVEPNEIADQPHLALLRY